MRRLFELRKSSPFPSSEENNNFYEEACCLIAGSIKVHKEVSMFVHSEYIIFIGVVET